MKDLEDRGLGGAWSSVRAAVDETGVDGERGENVNVDAGQERRRMRERVAPPFEGPRRTRFFERERRVSSKTEGSAERGRRFGQRLTRLAWTASGGRMSTPREAIVTAHPTKTLTMAVCHASSHASTPQNANSIPLRSL
jgi:hypothetical protein